MAGFTKVENDILQKVLTSDLTKRQLKILLLIIRFSYGYQKTYAVLRKNDFSYAGVSPYCIKDELAKLAKKRVILWNPERDVLWVNPDLDEWAVKKAGDSQGKFFRIAAKNSPKQQMSVYRNSNIRFVKTASPSIRRKNSKNIQREELFMKVMQDYFLKVAPLSESEMCMLRQVVESFPLGAIERAIETVSAESNRSFQTFLKALDGFTADARRTGRPVSLKLGIQDFWKRHHSP